MHDLVCERARGFAQYHVLAVDRDLASLHISSRSVVKLLVVQLELGRGIGDFDLGRIETKLARDLIDGALVEQVLTAPLLERSDLPQRSRLLQGQVGFLLAQRPAQASLQVCYELQLLLRALP